MTIPTSASDRIEAAREALARYDDPDDEMYRAPAPFVAIARALIEPPVNTVYLLTATAADYDEYQAWIVVAPDVETAWRIVKEKTEVGINQRMPLAERWVDRFLKGADRREATPGDGITVKILGTTDDDEGLRHVNFNAG